VDTFINLLSVVGDRTILRDGSFHLFISFIHLFHLVNTDALAGVSNASLYKDANTKIVILFYSYESQAQRG
jgi:hypothetical protein